MKSCVTLSALGALGCTKPPPPSPAWAADLAGKTFSFTTTLGNERRSGRISVGTPTIEAAKKKSGRDWENWVTYDASLTMTTALEPGDSTSFDVTTVTEDGVQRDGNLDGNSNVPDQNRTVKLRLSLPAIENVVQIGSPMRFRFA